MKYLLTFLLVILGLSCGKGGGGSDDPRLQKDPVKTQNTEPGQSLPGQSFKDYPDGQKERERILNLGFTPIDISKVHRPPSTVNTSLTTFYSGTAPKATVVGDYLEGPFRCFLAISLSWAFEKNLPPDILQVLQQKNLLNKKVIDIFIVGQPLSTMGGNKDGSTNNITYLKAHGWADPDAPKVFIGDRVNRNFLYGIFDAEVDISHEVQLNKLKPFNVHTHDGMYSPQTAALNLKSDTPKTMAFYSLVIDEEKNKGIVVLHILVSAAQEDDFMDEFPYLKRDDGTLVPTHSTLKAFIENLSKGPFKAERFVKDIVALTKID